LERYYQCAISTFNYITLQDPAIGVKSVWYNSKVLIEGADAQELHVGETVTFINWGNLIIKDIKRCESRDLTIQKLGGFSVDFGHIFLHFYASVKRYGFI